MIPVRAILHPTDFSVYADNACRFARMIAREYGARLIVLHVAGLDLNLPQPFQTDMGPAFDFSADEHTRDEALKKRLRDQFETDSGYPVETRVVYGDAAAEITRVAQEVPCDLIVMGTHGRSGLGRILMGSVAEAVLRGASCPVLTVKLPTVDSAANQRRRTHEAVKT